MSNHIEENQYLNLMKNIIEDGESDDNERTGVGTISTFGEQIKFDLRKGFPAITTKKLAWKAVVSELLWFLQGSTNVNQLRAILHGEENRLNTDKKTIWDANYNQQAIDLGYRNGEMGDIYGAGWRNFDAGVVYEYDSQYGFNDKEIEGIDQVAIMLVEAKENPSSRRLIVSAWNPRVVWGLPYNDYYVKEAALPPCHILYQLNIKGEYIDLQWYQRSVDVGAGLPFNIASYGLLLSIFARILNKRPRYLVGTLGNTHLYKNHIESAKIQIERVPFDAPDLFIDPELKTLYDFVNSNVEQYKLLDYKHHDTLKYPMAV